MSGEPEMLRDLADNSILMSTENRVLLRHSADRLQQLEALLAFVEEHGDA